MNDLAQPATLPILAVVLFVNVPATSISIVPIPASPTSRDPLLRLENGPVTTAVPRPAAPLPSDSVENVAVPELIMNIPVADGVPTSSFGEPARTASARQCERAGRPRHAH